MASEYNASYYDVSTVDYKYCYNGQLAIFKSCRFLKTRNIIIKKKLFSWGWYEEYEIIIIITYCVVFLHALSNHKVALNYSYIFYIYMVFHRYVFVHAVSYTPTCRSGSRNQNKHIYNSNWDVTCIYKICSDQVNQQL